MGEPAPLGHLGDAATRELGRSADPWIASLPSRDQTGIGILESPRDLTRLITALRWAVLGLGLLLTGFAATQVGAPSTAAALVAGLTLWRTLRPIVPVETAHRFRLDIALDLPILVLALLVSGAFDSPFALTPLPVLYLAAYRWGYLRGIGVAVVTLGVLGVGQLVGDQQVDAASLAVQGALVYIITAAIGGFSRSVRSSVEESARAVEVARSRVADEAGRMVAANDLLLALYAVTQRISTSLDLGEVIESTQRRFRELFDYTAAVIAVRDDTTSSWRIELAEGARMPGSLSPDRLPWDLGQAALARGPGITNDLLVGRRVGCSPYARSSLFAPLRTKDGLVGLIALEHREPDRFTRYDAQILGELAKPLALAVDNARWFGKLRTIGAEAERARIARDLHDRFAQSLAYVGFELERLGADSNDEASLLELRDLVRELVGELREMLHELRATVDDVTSLADAVRGHAKRFADRTDIDVHVLIPEDQPRLPVRVEQELWRIVQEALTNVERHAGAENAWIGFAVRGFGATLTIRDDGRGFTPAAVPRDRFGLVGMRERADAVGANITMRSTVGRGTELVIQVPVAQ